MATGGAIALVLLLAVNLIATITLRGFKIDITQENLYSLSDGSKSLLSKLDDEVRIKFFYSKRASSSIPVLKQYGERIIELLKQYESAGKGKIVLEVLEPRPDSEVEEWALKYGLRSIPIAGVESVYFGLAMVSEIGVEESIPFLDPNREPFLEYDITRLISTLASTEKKTLGIMSALNFMGGYGNNPMAQLSGQPPAEPWVAAQELKRAFDVQEIPMDADEIEDSIDLLLLIHPKSISFDTQYAIDQYLLRGGRAVVLVDPICEYEMMNYQANSPGAMATPAFNSSLEELFGAWGIEMDVNKIVGDPDLAMGVTTPQGVAEKFLAYIGVTDQNLNQDEIVSSNLERMVLAYAGALKIKSDAKYEITTLMESSSAGGEVDAFIAQLTRNPRQLLNEFAPAGEKLAFALKITGKFETAFRAGPPLTIAGPGVEISDEEKAREEEKRENHIAEAEEETTVVVISDVDFISDRFAVQKQRLFNQTIAFAINDNLNFLYNVLENMSGSQDLINLRTRGKSARPFTKVDELELKARDRYKDKEDELSQRLSDTNRRLSELESGKADSAQIITFNAEQLTAIERFREEAAETRSELRVVRLNLREDIERLGWKLKFINIALIPILVILAGFIPSIWRSARIKATHG